MVFYEFICSYLRKELPDEVAEDDPRPRRRKRDEFSEYISNINSQLGVECGLDKNLSLMIAAGNEKEMTILAGCSLEKVSLKKCKDYVGKAVMDACTSVEDVSIISEKEICPYEVRNQIKRADSMGYIPWHTRSFIDELNLDYLGCNYDFNVKEKCICKKLTYKQALKKAEELMADDTLLEELGRIYSKENSRKYCGNPVHYKISAGDYRAAESIIELLVSALWSNNRVLGTRVEMLTSIGERANRNDEELDDIFNVAQGNAVSIDMSGDDGMHGIYASAYEQVTERFNLLVKTYGLYTLCFFVENTSKPGFSDSMISKAVESISIIEINEGSGDRDKSIRLFKKLATERETFATETDFDSVLTKKKVYTVAEVYKAFNTWYGRGLRERIYKAYKTCAVAKVETKKPASEPYKELQEMIGLSEIKTVVDQIIDSGKAKKLRSKMGIDTYSHSMHMIFTGNPGSAKTSVARLLAQILKKEGVLESGNYVEVGRSDLIARYVGWTAKTVCEKFREAKGGILFIDEAYSLVDGSNSFGDEAINTIVQEMENHREDVIVIFAGYPEKMKEFLDKNEGLRSRIAFHLNFPDYKADEIWQILKLMAEKKGFKLGEGVESKCMEIFGEACEHEEFGNGRFARNLLEQAEMRQSQRLFRENKGKKISKEKIMQLKAEDFETVAGNQFKEKKQGIGFAV